MTKGTTSFGKRLTRAHELCRRCGKRSYHKQKQRCAACGFPSATKRKFNWSNKAIRRTTTGTGRMKHLRTVAGKAKGYFKEGGKPKKQATSS